TADGMMLGGAMYALETALKCKWGANLFAVFTVLASFGIGCTVQANAVSSTVQANFGVPLWISGVVITVLAGSVILGGIKSVTRVCTKLVPVMSIFYIVGCGIILFLNRAYLGQAIEMICTSAFTPRAAGGGFIAAGVMQSLRYGMARGLFSNEAGMGSAPIVDAAAQTPNAPRQALVSASGVFWDTVVLCALTGLVLVSEVICNPAVSATAAGGVANGATLTAQAFAQIPVVGPIVLVGGLITFAFSTILGWSYYGERAMEYLCGKRGIIPYRLLYVLILFVGSVVAIGLVWALADTFNALMAIPNIIAVLALSGVVARDTRYYVYGQRISEQDATPIPFVDNK
ncbi:MAG: amino acid carrier protein, partial [Clostridiales bacterium]